MFQSAVAAMDAGDPAEVESLVTAHPQLIRERLKAPGEWLRGKVGDSLRGFFKWPYLLWFVAEDPVRNGSLPPNIASIAGVLIEKAKQGGVESLQAQIDYTLRLVAWSWIARQSGVQNDLIDVLVNAGAAAEGMSDEALVNGNVEAAEHLVRRGAPLTLGTAACLGYLDDVRRLGSTATKTEKQLALVLAAPMARLRRSRRCSPPERRSTPRATISTPTAPLCTTRSAQVLWKLSRCWSRPAPT